MKRLKLTILIVVGWIIITSLYAYYYVVSILALPEEYDAYARNWKFQLLMFSLFRLPYMVLLLTILIGVGVVLPPRKQSSRIRAVSE